MHSVNGMVAERREALPGGRFDEFLNECEPDICAGLRLVGDLSRIYRRALCLFLNRHPHVTRDQWRGSFNAFVAYHGHIAYARKEISLLTKQMDRRLDSFLDADDRNRDDSLQVQTQSIAPILPGDRVDTTASQVDVAMERLLEVQIDDDGEWEDEKEEEEEETAAEAAA